eukprot:5659501-Pyramimonas_sp.AAC.1
MQRQRQHEKLRANGKIKQVTSEQHAPIPIGGTEGAMGACCRMGVPARMGAPHTVRQPVPVPIASPLPSEPPMGMGVCCSRAGRKGGIAKGGLRFSSRS